MEEILVSPLAMTVTLVPAAGSARPVALEALEPYGVPVAEIEEVARAARVDVDGLRRAAAGLVAAAVPVAGPGARSSGDRGLRQSAEPWLGGQAWPDTVVAGGSATAWHETWSAAENALLRAGALLHQLQGQRAWAGQNDVIERWWSGLASAHAPSVAVAGRAAVALPAAFERLWGSLPSPDAHAWSHLRALVAMAKWHVGGLATALVAARRLSSAAPGPGSKSAPTEAAAASMQALDAEHPRAMLAALGEASSARLEEALSVLETQAWLEPTTLSVTPVHLDQEADAVMHSRMADVLARLAAAVASVAAGFLNGADDGGSPAGAFGGVGSEPATATVPAPATFAATDSSLLAARLLSRLTRLLVALASTSIATTGDTSTESPMQAAATTTLAALLTHAHDRVRVLASQSVLAVRSHGLATLRSHAAAMAGGYESPPRPTARSVGAANGSGLNDTNAEAETDGDGDGDDHDDDYDTETDRDSDTAGSDSDGEDAGRDLVQGGRAGIVTPPPQQSNGPSANARGLSACAPVADSAHSCAIFRVRVRVRPRP